MDGEKLGEKNMIGIIDLTRVNQARHTISLRKDLEIYKGMIKK
jgi:hypothetical protein